MPRGPCPRRFGRRAGLPYDVATGIVPAKVGAERMTVIFGRWARAIAAMGLAMAIAKETAKRLINMGLDMQGQLRVKTDARVANHNAHKTIENATTGQKIFVWDVKTAL